MKKLLKNLFVYGLLAFLSYQGVVQFQVWRGKQAHHNTGLKSLQMDKALEQSAQTGQPIVVEFSAFWCGACRSFAKEVLSDPVVNQLIRDEFLFVRLDYDKDSDRPFFDQYGVNSLPTVYVLNAKAGWNEKMSSLFMPDRVVQSLKAALLRE